MSCTHTENKTCKINCLNTLVYQEFCDRSIPCLVLASKLKFKIILVSLNSRSERWNEKDCSMNQKNVLKNISKLSCLRTNNSFSSLLGDKQNFKFGGI